VVVACPSVVAPLLTKVFSFPLTSLGGKSRAANAVGGLDPYQAEDPNRQMLKETGAGVGTEVMQKNLSKEREYERILF
jgi:hypothetical protein